MLVHADQLVADKLGANPPNARFVVQPDETFPVEAPVDFMCVLRLHPRGARRHHRYLKAARAACTADATFVASVLQLELQIHQHTFPMSTLKTVDERWAEVRNVVTSQDCSQRLLSWPAGQSSCGYPPTESAGTMPDGERVGVGQSIVVMRPST